MRMSNWNLCYHPTYHLEKMRNGTQTCACRFLTSSTNVRALIHHQQSQHLVFFPTFKSKNLSINIVCLTDGSQNWIQRAAWTGTHTDTRDKSFQNSAILPDALLEIFLAFEKLHIIICVLHRTKKLWKNMISTGRLLKEKRNSLERAGTSNCSVSETLIS